MTTSLLNPIKKWTSANESLLQTLRTQNQPMRENLASQQAALKPPSSSGPPKLTVAPYSGPMTSMKPPVANAVPAPERPLATGGASPVANLGAPGMGQTTDESPIYKRKPLPNVPITSWIHPRIPGNVPPPGGTPQGTPPTTVTSPSGQTFTGGTPTPTPTVQPPAAPQSNISDLQRRVLESYGMSPEEHSAQQALDALIAKQSALGASEELGIEKVTQQRIPMEFVTGQTAGIQRQSAAMQRALASQATPIISQLGRAQAEREMNRQRAEAELGFQTPDLTSVAAGSSLYDPRSGKLVFTAPEATAESEGGKFLTPNEAAVLNVPYGTTRAEAAAMGVMPKGSLTAQDKIDLEVKLAKEWDNANKQAAIAKQQSNIIDASYNEAQRRLQTGESINAASQGVLVAFQKMLDPNSVVRESEYARSGEGLSLMSRLEGFYTKITQGGAGVSATDLKEFRDLGQEFLKGYEQAMGDTTARTMRQAENYGLNIENILPPSYLGDRGTESDTFVALDGTVFVKGDDGLYYPSEG